MLNKMMKGLVDLIYGTSRIKKKFELSNPTEKVLASDASKGIITTENQNVTKGANWLTSQRAVVMLTKSQIICGKWTIPIEEIQSSELLKISSLFGDGMVLKIQTIDNKNYQFGMQLNPEWTEQNALPLNLKKTKVKYSPFSILVRLIAIGYLIYWIYNRFLGN
jgi:hypothetical protein